MYQLELYDHVPQAIADGNIDQAWELADEATSLADRRRLRAMIREANKSADNTDDPVRKCHAYG